jgi:hypothetical protein
MVGGGETNKGPIKKDSREIRKKKRKICKKEITTKKKFGSLNERKS